MRLYIAGPMTGVPHFNFPLFDQVAEDLREHDYDVVSPAELDDPEDRARAMASPDGAPVHYTYGKTHADFLARDLKIIADRIDGIVVLPNWQKSTGARIETFIGFAYRKPIFSYEDGRLVGMSFLSLVRGWIGKSDISFHSEVAA